MKRLMAALLALATMVGCAPGFPDPYGPGPGKTIRITYTLYEIDRTGHERPAGANYVWQVSVTAQTLTHKPLEVSPGKPFGLSGIAKTNADGIATYETLIRDNVGPCFVTVTATLFTGGGMWAMGDFNGPPGTSVIGAVETGEIEVHEVGGVIRLQYDIKVD